MTYFCSIGSQILYIFETHGIGQTLSSLERYLVIIVCPMQFMALADIKSLECLSECVCVFLCVSAKRFFHGLS